MGVVKQEKVIDQEDFKYDPKTKIELVNIIDVIETVDTVPTSSPTSFNNQFKIYNNSGTYRFYWYDTENDEWRYATGT